MKDKPVPMCICCDNPFTIQYILPDCPDFEDTGRLFYESGDVLNLFKQVTKIKFLDLSENSDFSTRYKAILVLDRILLKEQN